jgi:hypothetical protein
MKLTAKIDDYKYLAEITVSELRDLYPASHHNWRVGESVPLQNAIVALQRIEAFAKSADLAGIERHARNVLDSVALIRSIVAGPTEQPK